jgi:ParB-like nuclease domain
LLRLARDIEANGMLQPVGVEQKPDGRYLLILGERRFRAAKIIGWREIPASILDTEKARRVLQLAENQQRANLLNSELGEAIESWLLAGIEPGLVSHRTNIPKDRLKFYRVVPRLCPALAAIVDRADIRAIYDLHNAWEAGSPEVKSTIEASVTSLGPDARLTQAEARELLGRRSVTNPDGPCLKHVAGPIRNVSQEPDKPGSEIPLLLRDPSEDLRPKPPPPLATELKDDQEGRNSSQTSRWRPSVKEFRKMKEEYDEAKRTVTAYETACTRMLEQVPEDFRDQVARTLQETLAELKAT